MEDVLLSVDGTNSISSQITNLVEKTNPNTICVATAYLTFKGSQFLDKISKANGLTNHNIVVGTSGEITQPNAVRFLVENNWQVRLGVSKQGIFHPKMLVVGNGYNDNVISDATGCYFGSANFTGPGLEKNTELGCTTTNNILVQGVANAFGTIWRSSNVFSEELLVEYERRFSQRVQSRSFLELVEIGGTDESTVETAIKSKPAEPVLKPENCSTVWVGLESFTGERTLQVEVPKGAKEVLKNIIGVGGERVDFKCKDGVVRSMLYDYYTDNGMARLNVPNDVPLVEWVRTSKQGALVISLVEGTELPKIEIVTGDDLKSIQERSFALATWGTTSTRKYGWY